MARAQPPLAGEAEATQALEAARRVLENAIRRRCFGLLASQREDLVQSAMLRLLERQGREDLWGRGPSYFWKVAQSVVVDELRRIDRDRRVAETVRKDREPWVDPVGGIALRRCLGRLEERRRMAVTLHLSGLRIPEVARAANWTVKAAENLIYRGLDDLRRLLAES
jgi:DNA-directed RNA polymerase specialized sigma24 family protein